MNKKALSLLAVLALGTVAGCGNTNTSSTSTPAPAKKYSVGLGYNFSYSYTADKAETTDKNEEAGQVDMTVAMAAFDEEGKVFDVRFDVVQVKFTATADRSGLTLTNTNVVDGSVTTKCELGDNYNMVAYGGSIAEVDQQIEAFADYCAGKTVEEVIASTVNPGHSKDHTPVCDALEGKVTITVDAFEAALKDAYNRKSTTTYELDGTAGVAMVSGLAYNYGNPQKDVSVDVAGVFAKDGKVEVALIDAIVVPMEFATGISVKADNYYNKDGVLRSKKVLGDEYGMKGTGTNHATGEACTLEWYEQAAIVENAAAGKTKDQIAAFAANEGELAGATITLNSYITALAKATDYAGKAFIFAR